MGNLRQILAGWERMLWYLGGIVELKTIIAMVSAGMYRSMFSSDITPAITNTLGMWSDCEISQGSWNVLMWTQVNRLQTWEMWHWLIHLLSGGFRYFFTDYFACLQDSLTKLLYIPLRNGVHCLKHQDHIGSSQNKSFFRKSLKHGCTRKFTIIVFLFNL